MDISLIKILVNDILHANAGVSSPSGMMEKDFTKRELSMLKFALSLLFAACLLPAVAHATTYNNIRPTVVLEQPGFPRPYGHPPHYGRRPHVAPGVVRTCPPGTRPMGQHGCAGATITDPAATRIHDEPIARGCVPGARRTIWKSGTDAQGRPVRWKIDQHAECGPRGE